MKQFINKFFKIFNWTSPISRIEFLVSLILPVILYVVWICCSVDDVYWWFPSILLGIYMVKRLINFGMSNKTIFLEVLKINVLFIIDYILFVFIDNVNGLYFGTNELGLIFFALLLPFVVFLIWLVVYLIKYLIICLFFKGENITDDEYICFWNRSFEDKKNKIITLFKSGWLCIVRFKDILRGSSRTEIFIVGFLLGITGLVLYLIGMQYLLVDNMLYLGLSENVTYACKCIVWGVIIFFALLTLIIRRLRDLDLPVWYSVFWFVPFMNLLLIYMLLFGNKKYK